MPHIEINGANIYYEDADNGVASDKEVVLFSHGLLFNTSMFSKQVAFLKSRYRCIAYDHRGQGKSELKGSLDMDTLTADAVGLINHLSLGPCHFVGLSMGGFVGMRLAARHSELLRSVSLVETSAQEEAFKRKYNLLKAVVRLFGVSSVTGRVMPIMFGQKFLKDPARAEERTYWRNYLSALPKEIVHAVTGVIDRESVERELGAIKLPTLILVGDQDKATPVPKAEFIARGITHAKLKVIPGAGHSSTIEEPERINSMLENFFREVAS